MTTDAIIMMVITLVGYVGGFTYFMVKVFKKEKGNSSNKNGMDCIKKNTIFLRKGLQKALSSFILKKL